MYESIAVAVVEARKPLVFSTVFLVSPAVMNEAGSDSEEVYAAAFAVITR